MSLRFCSSVMGLESAGASRGCTRTGVVLQFHLVLSKLHQKGTVVFLIEKPHLQMGSGLLSVRALETGQIV